MVTDTGTIISVDAPSRTLMFNSDQHGMLTLAITDAILATVLMRHPGPAHLSWSTNDTGDGTLVTVESLTVASRELVRAGWTRNDDDQWCDPQTGESMDGGLAVLALADRPAHDGPVLGKVGWCEFRVAQLRAALTLYGRHAVEQIAIRHGLTGLRSFALAELPEQILIDLIVEHEAADRFSEATPVIYLEVSGWNINDFNFALRSLTHLAVIGSGSGFGGRDYHLEVDDPESGMEAIRTLARSFRGVRIDRLELVEDEEE